MNLYNETKTILKKHNLNPNKKLGQNFLIDNQIVEEIINASNINEDTLVIEIGPGLGTLTEPLLQKAGKVICIELDKNMVEILQQRFLPNEKLEIINDDVLKVNLKEIIEKENFKTAKIVANLPYYITTPIIMKLLEDRLKIDTITVMIQKEVAERLTTIPGTGDTGAITYSIYYYTEPRKIIEVPNTSFMPEPEVNSTVIQLEVLKQPRVQITDEKKLFKIIKCAFMQKRKTLLNSLTNSNQLGTKQEIEQILTDLNIEKTIRPEKMTLDDFAKISEQIKNITIS